METKKEKGEKGKREEKEEIVSAYDLYSHSYVGVIILRCK